MSDNMEKCLEELELLKSIDASLKKLADGDYARGEYMGWTYYQIGKSWFYEQRVTYAGATMSINLDFRKAIQLNRIEQIWNDATARDFSIRMYTAPGSSSTYIELDAQTANVALNRVIQAGSEYKYPAGTRFQAYYATFTAGKTCKIVVQADEL